MRGAFTAFSVALVYAQVTEAQTGFASLPTGNAEECSPGCTNDMIDDGTCQDACNNAACHKDGDDCYVKDTAKCLDSRTCPLGTFCEFSQTPVAYCQTYSLAGADCSDLNTQQCGIGLWCNLDQKCQLQNNERRWNFKLQSDLATTCLQSTPVEPADDPVAKIATKVFKMGACDSDDTLIWHLDEKSRMAVSTGPDKGLCLSLLPKDSRITITNDAVEAGLVPCKDDDLSQQFVYLHGYYNEVYLRSLTDAVSLLTIFFGNELPTSAVGFTQYIPRNSDWNNVYDTDVDCVIGEWLEWSECSVPCGQGTQARYRRVFLEPEQRGDPCPSIRETRPCQANEDCDPAQESNPEDAWTAPAFIPEGEVNQVRADDIKRGEENVEGVTDTGDGYNHTPYIVCTVLLATLATVQGVLYVRQRRKVQNYRESKKHS
eukprot:Clim_evm105s25 gene=Clim_evmTU105s25